jgi:hypothetical protein
MTAMLGFLALALDVGLFLRSQRNMQIAADAAATAGALNYLYYADATLARNAARDASKSNQFEHGVGGTDVTVNVPPLSGPNQKNGFVEAIISKPVPTVLMRMFGHDAVTVAVRAVAGSPGWSLDCIQVMNKHSSDTFDIQGSGTIDAPGCSIYVNSDNSTAAQTNGTPTYTGPRIKVVGGYQGKGNTISQVTTGVTAESPLIPLSLSAPDTPSACGYSTGITSVTTANQAPIVTGSAINGVVCFTAAVTLNNGVSLPGSARGVQYIFEKGVTIGSTKTDTVTIGSAPPQYADGTFGPTQGATMIITDGTCSQSTGGNLAAGLNVYAPTQGTYNSIALMIPQSNPDHEDLTVQWGNTNSVFDGLIFAPNQRVFLQDNGGGVKASGIIADQLFVKASTLHIPSYSAANPTTTPFKQITLVE